MNLANLLSAEGERFLPDLKRVIEDITEILGLVFPGKLPPVIMRSVGIVLLILSILLTIWTVFWLFSKLKQLWSSDIRPFWYKPEYRAKVIQRKRFAGYLAEELLRQNRREEWNDYRFAELEAEVEAEGLTKSRLSLRHLTSRTSTLRHEKTLSKAIENSDERLILIEGEPGSGKSVALRHVAMKMAERSQRARNIDAVLPVYVNLKQLTVSADIVQRKDIEALVTDSLTRINDRDVAEFVNEHFLGGLPESTWMFLFDSFDEIPDVLGSVEPDHAVNAFSNAIADFMSGANRCRAVLASRHFRGPRQFGWPRFRILSLSAARQDLLIKRSGLSGEQINSLRVGLRTASTDISEMSRNPMFLSLLCDYVRRHGAFPDSVHQVFDTYTQSRLTRDENRLVQRFHLRVAEIQDIAEKIGFCMSAEPGLGLTPSRDQLMAALEKQGLLPEIDLDTVLKALEYVKLARSEELSPGDSELFTFSHRRFQEYFATSIVLRNPERVPPASLLMDGRWRETAVAMFQLQPGAAVAQMISAAEAILTTSLRCLSSDKHTPFAWPQGSLHLARILQDGFHTHPTDLPDSLRHLVGDLVVAAFRNGDLVSQKFAVEVAGTAPSRVFINVLRSAFRSPSNWLSDTAYRQIADLSSLPEDVAQFVRLSIIRMGFSGRLTKDRHYAEACLTRLHDSKRYMFLAGVIRRMFRVDLLFHLVALVAFVQLHRRDSFGAFQDVAAASFLSASFLVVRYHASYTSSALFLPLRKTLRWQATITLRVVLLSLLCAIALLTTQYERGFPPSVTNAIRAHLFRHPEKFVVAIVFAVAGLSASLAAFFWLPSMLYLAINGDLTSRWRLIFAPFTAFYKGLLTRQLVAKFVWIQISVVLVVFVFKINLVYLSLPILAVGVYLVGSIMVSGYSVMRDSIKDRLFLKRFNFSVTMSGDVFVESLNAFRTAALASVFVRQVQRRNCLINEGQTTLLLQQTARQRQSKLNRGYVAELDRSNTASIRTGFFFDPLLTGPNRGEEDAELVDELFILLERIGVPGLPVL